MADSNSKPEGNQALFDTLDALDLQDEILKRTAQVNAICRLAGTADVEAIGNVMHTAMWGVECLLKETNDLVGRLEKLAISAGAHETPQQISSPPAPAARLAPAVDSKAAGVDLDALGSDLSEIASAAFAIRKVTMDDSTSEDTVEIQALAEKAGYMADLWLSRLGKGLVVGDTFEDWNHA
jgi:hypothetical protein